MKKFSKLTKQKINKEPKIEYHINESDILKSELLSLMDRYLRTKAYGSVDNRFMNGKVVIEGKDHLVEAIMDLITKNDNDKKIKILESLKSDILDWETLDNKINSIKKTDFNNKLLFEKMMKRYDDDNLILFIENNINDIKDVNFIIDRINVINESSLNFKTKETLIDIYNKKIIELNGEENN